MRCCCNIFEQTAPPQTCAEAVLLAAAEALRTLLGAEEVRFVVRLGTLLKELTFPGQIHTGPDGKRR